MARFTAGDDLIRNAFKWSRDEPLTGRAIAVAALGMSLPVVVGLALGKPKIGFTVGLGAMLLAGETPTSAAAGQDRPSPESAIAPAALAVGLATLITGAAWTDLAMIALAGAAAVISGYSRPVGLGAIRFIIYLILSVSLLQSAGDHRSWAALVFGLGALWNIAVRLMLGAPASKNAAASSARKPTPAQRRAYWRRTMEALEGWQYPIRLVLGLSAASGLHYIWPSHHYGWIVLTVALLTQRPIEHLPVKTIQRMLGTLLGVGATWAILAGLTSPIVLGGVICLLATLAAVARARSYLVYSAASTPVILLVMDFGKRVDLLRLTDRLVATLLGAAIVISANVLLDRLLSRRPQFNMNRT